MPFGIGPLELVIILAIVLLIFGARRLPEMGKSLGSGMREFKRGITGDKDVEALPPEPPAEPPALPAARAEEPTRPNH